MRPVGAELGRERFEREARIKIAPTPGAWDSPIAPRAREVLLSRAASSRSAAGSSPREVAKAAANNRPSRQPARSTAVMTIQGIGRQAPDDRRAFANLAESLS
jgi:hypothetical protein